VDDTYETQKDASVDRSLEDGVSVEDAWGETPHRNKEDDKIDAMLRHTLRDGISVTEDNINGDIPQKVKDAYCAPSAAEIRASVERARDLVPELTSRKVDGNADFAMTYMYKDRAPPETIGEDADEAEWGVTDAYMYQKSQKARRT
jgi:hypothetical protein